MILAFEGLPAVGKSTTAKALASQGRTYVIPEVNRLFHAPKSYTEDWYFDRQVARWEIAAKQADTFDRVVFDGDPFQPLWFNWIFAHERRWASVTDMAEFYRRQISQGRIAFPDVYVYFRLGREELRRRRYERDHVEGPATIEAKFKKYLLMERPMGMYFRTLAEAFPGRVVTLDANCLDSTVAAIGNIQPPADCKDDMLMLEVLHAFLERTPPPATRWCLSTPGA